MSVDRRRILGGFLSVGAAGLFPQRPLAQSPTATKTWFLRLIPPRPTFDKDATPAENALMEQHLAYWKSHYDHGVCVFGGPVFDPKGVYGVLAVQAATEEEARNLADGDPSVKAGLNRLEMAEMQAVFLHRAG